MDILLHICCAPCSLYTIDKLRQDGHKVQGFFYNPNIYPLSEYKLRRQAVVDMANRLSVNVTYRDGQWQPLGGAFRPTFAAAKQQRCSDCWRMRLCETSKMAKDAGAGAFSTTLLISPYQNHDEIKDIGHELAKEQSIDFYYDDFRIGFKSSQAMAKGAGFYRQRYCGCKYSIKVTGTF